MYSISYPKLFAIATIGIVLIASFAILAESGDADTNLSMTDENNTVFMVNDEMIDSAVAASDGKVYIGSPTTPQQSFSVSGESMKTVADAGMDLVISNTTCSTTLPNSVIKDLSGKEMILTMRNVEESELNDAQRSSVKDGCVLCLNISADGSDIKVIGEAVTVEVPYKLGDNEIADTIEAFCLLGDGGLDKVPGNYNYGLKSYEMQIEQFDTYVVRNMGAENIAAADTGLIIIFVIAILAGFALITPFLRKI